VARLTLEAWQKERDKMIKACNRCHSANFAKAELAKGGTITFLFSSKEEKLNNAAALKEFVERKRK